MYNNYTLSIAHNIRILTMQRNYDYILKIVLVGSTSVGKSALLKRVGDEEFS